MTDLAIDAGDDGEGRRPRVATEGREWPTPAVFELLMQTRGWALFPRVIPPEQINAICHDCDRVYELCRAVQIKNGVAGNMEGTAHHVAGYGGALDAFINDFPLYDEIEQYFRGRFIVLNFGAVRHPAGGMNYTFKPHRDVRAFTGDYRLSLNMLVMLADFTPENGGTLVLPGSHRMEETPPAEQFHGFAEQIVGRAGDIVLFDSLLVHAACANRSDTDRRALTLCLGRPFMKPQMDWPRFLPRPFQEKMPDRVRQLMGFNARVPENLDEYYQPAENWTFKADQR